MLLPAPLRALLQLLLGFVLAAPVSAAAEDLDVVLAWAGPDDSAAAAGARQGLAEAAAQGRFLGQSYRLVTLENGRDQGLAPLAVIVAGAPERVLALADEFSGRPVLNVTAREDSLREACVANLLNVIPSYRMLADAEAQWQRVHPGDSARAMAWHPTFRKYAAAQLNSRFEKAAGRPMTDAGWAGWAAVKVLADTVARIASDDPARVLEALRGELAFDGQKGSGMSFRDTGQLRQPLLLVRNDEIVGEAPVRGAARPGDLDSLGLERCPK